MSKKWSAAGSLLAATVAAATLAGAGPAAAAPANLPNPNTCRQVSACGTGDQPAPLGNYTIWCDWDGQVADYFLVFVSGTVTRVNVNGGGDRGTVACYQHAGLATSVHVEVYLKAFAVQIKVGWHI